MLTKSRVIYLTIYVSDIDRSRDFYEGALGYRVLEEDAASVKYSAGHVILHLNRAVDYSIELRGGKDRSIALTFLVDDLEVMRAALEDRGLHVTPTVTSKAGAMADLYDPDGHWISLYQPFEAALDWPSGRKIQALRAPENSFDAGGTSLNGHDLIYLFLFVQDLDRTSAFYHDALGLTHVETSSCHRGVTSIPDGVVKYDVGGTLLTTHHVPDCCHAEIHKVTTEGNAGVAIGFHTADLRAAVAELEMGGLVFTDGTIASGIGPTATFLDPGGHVYYLCEPSPQALTRPGGAAIERILAAKL